jgi:hypothetical protein
MTGCPLSETGPESYHVVTFYFNLLEAENLASGGKQPFVFNVLFFISIVNSMHSSTVHGVSAGTAP